MLNIITRLIVGGARETTILTAFLLLKNRWTVDLISGSETGARAIF
ncbi:MAG: hypothetical protein R2941_13145 [Desulfobacterales bacterium]